MRLLSYSFVWYVAGISVDLHEERHIDCSPMRLLSCSFVWYVAGTSVDVHDGDRHIACSPMRLLSSSFCLVFGWYFC